MAIQAMGGGQSVSVPAPKTSRMISFTQPAQCNPVYTQHQTLQHAEPFLLTQIVALQAKQLRFGKADPTDFKKWEPQLIPQNARLQCSQLSQWLSEIPASEKLPQLIGPNDRGKRMEVYFELLEKACGIQQPQNNLEAYCLVMNAITTLERRAFGKEKEDPNKMSAAGPHTFFNFDVKDGNQLIACRNRKGFIFFAPDGRFEIWRRDPILNFDRTMYQLVSKSFPRKINDPSGMYLFPLIAGQTIELKTGLVLHQTYQPDGTTQQTYSILEPDTPETLSYFDQVRYFPFQNKLKTINLDNLNKVIESDSIPVLNDQHIQELNALFEKTPLAQNLIESYAIADHVLYTYFRSRFESEQYNSKPIFNLRHTLYRLNDGSYMSANPGSPFRLRFQQDGALTVWFNQNQGTDQAEDWELFAQRPSANPK